MFEKNDVKRLYWLINKYIASEVSEQVFCDEFHESFVNEIDVENLNDHEFETFSALNEAVQHFTQSEGDLKLWKGFIDKKELRARIIEAKNRLIKNRNE